MREKAVPNSAVQRSIMIFYGRAEILRRLYESLGIKHDHNYGIKRLLVSVMLCNT